MPRLWIFVCSLNAAAGHLRSESNTTSSWYKTITPSENTGLCIDAPGGNAFNGNMLWLWQCNGLPSQLWVFDNWQMRYGGDEGYCIDAGGMGDGQQLYLWSCNGYPQQTWGYDAEASRVYLSGTGTCLDFYEGQQWSGQALHVWSCNGYTSQQWSLWDAEPSPSPSPSPAPSGSITVLQWNPHWECFAHSDACKNGAHAALTSTLTGYSVDFANVVELDGYSPPGGYEIGHSCCKDDWTVILYNSARWSPAGDLVCGCMTSNNRAYVVWAFQNTASGMKVIMVGAHYPHPGQGDDSQLRSSVQSVMGAVPDAAGVIFAADTNFGGDTSTAKILGGLTGSGYVIATDLLPTCCEDSSYANRFDRVGSTFGSGMTSQLLFDPAPDWVHGISGAGYHGEFHKGVIGTFATNTYSVV